jgi:hypothetical protein
MEVEKMAGAGPAIFQCTGLASLSSGEHRSHNKVLKKVVKKYG